LAKPEPAVCGAGSQMGDREFDFERGSPCLTPSSTRRSR
jgi:hypothetical protein